MKDEVKIIIENENNKFLTLDYLEKRENNSEEEESDE